VSTRYEILPFGSADSEVEAAPRPLVITVTCSPRHGVDHTVDVAAGIAALGHKAVVHLAARMVRGADHLDAVLERLARNGLDEVFLIGGDGQAEGPYASAVELLPIIASHDHRPRRIGIGAYPEGHPLIDPVVLGEALRRKAQMADYMVTQLCFDPAALSRWLEDTRAEGIDLPVYVGIPGAVDRRRLLEISMRVGVGTSVAFLRKQRGIARLFRRPEHAADRLHEVFAPLVGDARLGIAGLHFFTFNRLGATLAWQAGRIAGQPSYDTTTTGAVTS
jgi:methylenetetrahydrofolate reductase (NADPH)